MKQSLSFFLKGILMGICDVIPGISGGTIAFITGIYSRLIDAVKGFSPKLAIDFFNYISRRDKKSFLEDVKKLDLGFLIILGLGIGTAILIGARVIGFLLEIYFTYTLAFFIGLILASSKSIYDKIESHYKRNKIFGVIGFVVGILFMFMIPVKVSPDLLYIFLGGFLAISAMFLPGISGAFILLVLGLYGFMLDILHHLFDNLIEFFVFGLGALLGMFSISRAVSFLFRKAKSKTLYFLLGLVIGSLSIPIRNIFQSGFSWNILNSIVVLLFLILGLISARSIDKLNEKNKT